MKGNGQRSIEDKYRGSSLQVIVVASTTVTFVEVLPKPDRRGRGEVRASNGDLGAVGYRPARRHGIHNGTRVHRPRGHGPRLRRRAVHDEVAEVVAKRRRVRPSETEAEMNLFKLA